jgi:hypothetical protein
MFEYFTFNDARIVTGIKAEAKDKLINEIRVFLKTQYSDSFCIKPSPKLSTVQEGDKFPWVLDDIGRTLAEEWNDMRLHGTRRARYRYDQDLWVFLANKVLEDQGVASLPVDQELNEEQTALFNNITTQLADNCLREIITPLMKEHDIAIAKSATRIKQYKAAGFCAISVAACIGLVKYPLSVRDKPVLSETVSVIDAISPFRLETIITSCWLAAGAFLVSDIKAAKANEGAIEERWRT